LEAAITSINIVHPQDITENHIFEDIPANEIAYPSTKISTVPKNQSSKTSKFDQSVIRK